MTNNPQSGSTDLPVSVPNPHEISDAEYIIAKNAVAYLTANGGKFVVANLRNMIVSWPHRKTQALLDRLVSEGVITASDKRVGRVVVPEYSAK